MATWQRLSYEFVAPVFAGGLYWRGFVSVDESCAPETVVAGVV